MSWYKTLSSEVGRLMWFITIPQIISAPVSVFIIDMLQPSLVVLDILEIIDFLVISFPLTLAITMITYLVVSDESNAVSFILIVIGAALLSNFFHNALWSSFPEVDVDRIWRANTAPDPIYRSRGIGPMLNTALRILGIYWREFGIVIWLQALGIGIYAGRKYFGRQ
jgi:hypothetical protein